MSSESHGTGAREAERADGTEAPTDNHSPAPDTSPNGSHAHEPEAPEATAPSGPEAPAAAPEASADGASPEVAPPSEPEAPAAEAAAPSEPEAPVAAAPGEAEAPAAEAASPTEPKAPAAEAASPSEPEAPPAAPEAGPDGAKPAEQPKPAKKGQAGKKPGGKRPREPLPWAELRAAAAVISADSSVNDLKDMFRQIPGDVRQETIEGVRTYRKGARRPVSAFAGKALARAFHTARRNRRKPEADGEVAEALGQALAAEIVASLDVETAAEVILPKRDLLERQARQARRDQRDQEERRRDDDRRRRRDEGRDAASGRTAFGTFSGSKIRGLDQLQKLLDEQKN